MTTKSLAELGDFAGFVFKNMQEIIRAALLKGDIDTLETVANELNKAFRRELEAAPIIATRIQGYQIELGNVQPGDNRGEIEDALRRLKERLAATASLETAKGQIFFGLSGYALERYVNGQDDHNRRAAQYLMRFLPNDFPKLVTLFASVITDRASDRWGWHWWDLQPDGEAHFVDTFTRPNRTFIVRALQILADAAGAVLAPPTISDDLIFMCDSNNAQGVVATLNAIEGTWDRYAGLLNDQAHGQIGALRELFNQMKNAGVARREQRLREAPIDQRKVDEFKASVAAAFAKSSRLRNIVAVKSKVVDRSSAPPPEGQLSWGYNQLDDKGAFIPDWYVSYGRWGEHYGQGLAQAETDRAFGDMTERAATKQTVAQVDLIREIASHIDRAKWKNPIVLETLTTTIEYANVRNKERFVPGYSPDLASMEESRVDGFRGVIKVGAVAVPLFGVHTREKDHANKVLICDLAKFVEWERFSPADKDDQRADIFQNLLIKVLDLNVEDERRNKLLRENPPWLAEKGNLEERELYLRTKVVVNVYDRYSLHFIDATAAVCLTVVRARGEDPGGQD